MIRSLGVHDAFTAVVAERAGFETLFLGGFGASASLLGMPDLNLITLSEMAAAVRRMAARLRVPLVADADTGHGGVHNMARAVREFEAAGAAGLIIEDQVAPKRCGHFEGKDVVAAGEMVLRLRAALAARSSKHFVIIARTDARTVRGFNEAVRRANLYVKTGADVAFIEAPHSERELEAIPKRVKAPLLVNVLTGGRTPALPAERLEKMGYKIAVYPIESLMVTAAAVRRLAESVLTAGGVSAVASEMVGFSELKDILGLPEMLRATSPARPI